MSRKYSERVIPVRRKRRIVSRIAKEITGVDRRFSRRDRHVRRIGNESRSLHNRHFFAIHFHFQLEKDSLERFSRRKSKQT